jgi:hypothetical protein
VISTVDKAKEMSKCRSRQTLPKKLQLGHGKAATNDVQIRLINSRQLVDSRTEDHSYPLTVISKYVSQYKLYGRMVYHLLPEQKKENMRMVLSRTH